MLTGVNGFKTTDRTVQKDRRSSGVFISVDGGGKLEALQLVDYVASVASQQPNFALLWHADRLFLLTGHDGSHHPQGANGEASEMKCLAMKIIPGEALRRRIDSANPGVNHEPRP